MKYTFLFILFFLSCKNKTNLNIVKTESFKSDIFFKNYNNIIKTDTLIFYKIDDLSSEGAVAKVEYLSGIVKYIKLNIAGSGGKCETEFHFEKDNINIIDICYMYKDELNNINSLDDMVISEKKIIFIKKGKQLSKDENEYFELLLLLKKNIPFILTDNKTPD